MAVQWIASGARHGALTTSVVALDKDALTRLLDAETDVLARILHRMACPAEIDDPIFPASDWRHFAIGRLQGQ
jgi:hypothetical protein